MVANVQKRVAGCSQSVGIVLAALVAGSLAVACGHSHEDESPTTESAQTAGGRLGSHAMVITGTADAAFISHVPLYNQPHDVQLVAQGTVTPVGSAQPPPSFTDQLFTYVPDVFSLDALRLGTLKTLTGQVFVGSDEHGGRPLQGKFEFTVSKVVHQQVLDQHAAPTPLTYVVFGTKDKTFAVHKIGGAPSFDEVLHVTLGGASPPTNDALAAGVEATVGTTTDVAASRLGSTSSALTVQSNGETFTLTKATSLSCLVSPDFFDACR